MNKDDLIKVFKRIEINYPNTSNLKEILLDWKQVLQNMDYEIVNSNLNNHLSTSPYFPKLSDLTKNHSVKVKSTIPDLEETQSYINSLKALEKESAGKDVAMKYIEQMKRELGFND